MFRVIRTRLTFANVVAMMALFIALGGGFYAAAKGKKKVKASNVASLKVNAAGGLVAGSAGVSAVRTATGTYCVGAPFTPKAGVATIDNNAAGVPKVYVEVPPNAGTCPAGKNKARVVAYPGGTTTTPPTVDRPFYLILH